MESLAALAIDPRLRSALEGAAEVELSGGISHMPSSTCKRHSRRKTMGRRQQLVLAYLQSGHPERAAEQLRAAMRLDPKNAGPHTLLSQVESAQGDLSAGRGGAGGAVKLAPGDADGWNNLGVLHARSGRKDEARQDFARALAIAPGHVEAAANLRRLDVAGQVR